MGCFSWKTADTNRSIRHGQRAFLLQPDGKPPIADDCYSGHGDFGDVDAYAWLAQSNLPAEMLEGLDEDSVRCLGIALEVGEAFRDTRTGEIWSIYDDHRVLVGGSFFGGRYDEIGDAWGMTPNAAIEAGILVAVPVSTLRPVKYPLKFSFRADAVYENLPASADCPDQGY